MSLLIIERGPDSGRRIALTDFPVTIGRDPANQIALSDEEISRFHLRIKQRGRLVIVEDLDSRNGSFLNGDRILNSILKSGDKLLIGSTEIVFLASQSNIQLATEILDMDMVVAEELGLAGPIEVNETAIKKKFKPIRLNQMSVINQLPHDAKAVKSLFEMHGNILVLNDLEEAASTLLKCISQVLPNASRAAFFSWVDVSHQLVPTAVKHFGKKNSFIISQRALEDVITRKQGIILQAEAPQVTQSGRTRAVLPMLHNERVVGVVHIEFDNPELPVAPADLEVMQTFIARCSPSFECMLLHRELDGWLVGMIETMVATVEAKDTYTRGHSERVSRYCMAIADELKLNKDLKKLLMVSALCHDIGKIGVPDAILKKASLLSAEEYNEMKLHPTIGADIISGMPNAKRFLSGIKHHHEKWDGSGYPDGLAGEDIPFFGRIVAIADVFDAMISGRSYSGFMDQGDAVTRLNKEKDLFDPEIVKAFNRAYNNGSLTLKTSTLNQANPLFRKSQLDLDFAKENAADPDVKPSRSKKKSS